MATREGSCAPRSAVVLSLREDWGLSKCGCKSAPEWPKWPVPVGVLLPAVWQEDRPGQSSWDEYGKDSEGPNVRPEQQARQDIDAQLLASGWFVQDFTKMDLSPGRGIGLRKVPLKSGRSDYLLLVDRKPLSVLEAKKKRTLLSTVARQSGQRIVAEVERRLSVVEELEAAVTANLQCAERIRQSILQKAFTRGLVS
jgi:hypothetical protein